MVILEKLIIIIIMLQTNTYRYKPNKDFPLQDNRNDFQALAIQSNMTFQSNMAIILFSLRKKF